MDVRMESLLVVPGIWDLVPKIGREALSGATGARAMFVDRPAASPHRWVIARYSGPALSRRGKPLRTSLATARDFFDPPQ